MLIRCLPILGLLLLAAGCTTTSIDQAIARNLPTICKNADTAHLAFVAVVSTGKVSERTIRSEGIAYKTVVGLCTQTETVDSAAVLVAVTAAYLEMTKALKTAEAVEGT